MPESEVFLKGVKEVEGGGRKDVLEKPVLRKEGSNETSSCNKARSSGESASESRTSGIERLACDIGGSDFTTGGVGGKLGKEIGKLGGDIDRGGLTGSLRATRLTVGLVRRVNASLARSTFAVIARCLVAACCVRMIRCCDSVNRERSMSTTIPPLGDRILDYLIAS